ncbi:hypothetical protein GRF59_03330 [Paenibacillus sp. HJL G12]|uniref:VanZ-like domain-containing protein n=1 Tax=Paenibacillus dendrobii TaxID=2691084 RepID=A0A7X3LGY6_9BACL|nr:VanZ family protein [Paenibacillus dendrobii]MWV42649.1 hypothetical protein [Paenibacillus dendrobii]
MYQGKFRKIIITVLGLYTLLTLYFIFIGFQRGSLSQDPSLRFNVIPGGIPLHLPIGRDYRIWVFEWSNFLAFIPFGILIPLLFRCTFFRFIGFFILSITILETLQMISRLGAFDIDDIIINTIGAAVGYASQRLVVHHRFSMKAMCRIILTAVVISAGTIIVVGGINQYVEHGEGKTVALNDLALAKGTVLWDESLTGFTADQTKVEPRINLYSRKNVKNNAFSYQLKGQYARMSGYAAIPDDVNNASTGRTQITFTADGTEIYELVLGEHHPDSFHIPLHGVDKLTISFYTDNPNPDVNVVMWDTTLTEANTGQRIIKGIKSLF